MRLPDGISGRPARAYGWVAVAATPAILVGAAALGAPWPAVPALSLALAVTAALTGALAPPVDTPPGAQPVNAPSSARAVNAPHVGRAVGVPGGVPAAANTPLDAEAVGVPGGAVAAADVPPSAPAVGVPGGVLAAVAVLTGGAGLAGALATPAATITGLGAAVVAAAVCGMAGRHPGARVAGWLAIPILPSGRSDSSPRISRSTTNWRRATTCASSARCSD